jgi:hypothetical protein
MSERKRSVRGLWSVEYPRNQVRVTQSDEKGAVRNVPNNRPYLPADPGRRARLLALLRKANERRESS